MAAGVPVARLRVGHVRTVPGERRVLACDPSARLTRRCELTAKARAEGSR